MQIKYFVCFSTLFSTTHALIEIVDNVENLMHEGNLVLAGLDLNFSRNLSRPTGD